MAYDDRSGPVMVKVSPLTAVVTFCVPAILNVSPMFKPVPVESSPTIVTAVDPDDIASVIP